MRIALVLLLSSLAGCATCRDHPVMCPVQRQMDAQLGAALAGQRPPITALTHP